MLKKSFFSLFALLFITFYAQAKISSYDEVVSLGYSCQVVWQLETNGMRKFAYPFDWVHTTSESLLTFINQKGVGFLDLDKLIVVGPYPGDPSRLHVVDSVYGIQSYHDFLTSPPFSNYDEIKAKYERRIQRFFDLLNSKKRILFVREGLTRSQVEYLDQVLKTTYPKLSYTILAVHNDAEYHEDWGLKRIKNFYLSQTPGDWMGDFARWKEILSNFHIKPLGEARDPAEVW